MGVRGGQVESAINHTGTRQAVPTYMVQTSLTALQPFTFCAASSPSTPPKSSAAKNSTRRNASKLMVGTAAASPSSASALAAATPPSRACASGVPSASAGSPCMSIADRCFFADEESSCSHNAGLDAPPDSIQGSVGPGQALRPPYPVNQDRRRSINMLAHAFRSIESPFSRTGFEDRGSGLPYGRERSGVGVGYCFRCSRRPSPRAGASSGQPGGAPEGCCRLLGRDLAERGARAMLSSDASKKAPRLED